MYRRQPCFVLQANRFAAKGFVSPVPSERRCYWTHPCFKWHRLGWKSQSSAGKPSAKSQCKALLRVETADRMTPLPPFSLALSSHPHVSFSHVPLTPPPPPPRPFFFKAQQSCNPLTFGSFTVALGFAARSLPEQRQTSGQSLPRSCWRTFNKEKEKETGMNYHCGVRY